MSDIVEVLVRTDDFGTYQYGLQRAAFEVRLSLADDRRTFVLRRGVNPIPRDFWLQWIDANRDADLLALCIWNGKDEDLKPMSRRTVGAAVNDELMRDMTFQGQHGTQKLR